MIDTEKIEDLIKKGDEVSATQKITATRGSGISKIKPRCVY